MRVVPVPGGADSAAMTRVVWEQAGAASFRQRWEASRDGGATWTPQVVVLYLKH